LQKKNKQGKSPLNLHRLKKKLILPLKKTRKKKENAYLVLIINKKKLLWNTFEKTSSEKASIFRI